MGEKELVILIVSILVVAGIWFLLIALRFTSDYYGSFEIPLRGNENKLGIIVKKVLYNIFILPLWILFVAFLIYRKLVLIGKIFLYPLHVSYVLAITKDKRITPFLDYIQEI